MISVLLIGGKCNGTRTTVESNAGSHIIFKERNLETYNSISSLSPEFEIKTEHYNIHNIGFDSYIGIHESLTTKQAIELLIKKYPKKKKVRFFLPKRRFLKSIKTF